MALLLRSCLLYLSPSLWAADGVGQPEWVGADAQGVGGSTCASLAWCPLTQQLRCKTGAPCMVAVEPRNVNAAGSQGFRIKIFLQGRNIFISKGCSCTLAVVEVQVCIAGCWWTGFYTFVLRFMPLSSVNTWTSLDWKLWSFGNKLCHKMQDCKAILRNPAMMTQITNRLLNQETHQAKCVIALSQAHIWDIWNLAHACRCVTGEVVNLISAIRAPSQFTDVSLVLLARYNWPEALGSCKVVRQEMMTYSWKLQTLVSSPLSFNKHFTNFRNSYQIYINVSSLDPLYSRLLQSP